MTNHNEMKRRDFWKTGLLLLLAPNLHLISSGAYAAKIPRTHGPKTKRIIELQTGHKPGTIIISNSNLTLDFVLTGNTVARYSVAIGRDGFTWTDDVVASSKREWPTWRPPQEMRQRDTSLPESVPPGPFNPLGARAIYLFKNGQDTLYRIHGTNDADSVGGYETSGCFRMTNADILELYPQIPVGARVIVAN